MNNKKLWENFEETGSVEAYLAYRFQDDINNNQNNSFFKNKNTTNENIFKKSNLGNKFK